MSLDPSELLVLHVNDNAVSRYLTGKLLRNAGYRTEDACDGFEALARLARDPLPGLVVLDVKMPGLDGFEVCARIRSDARTASVKVVHTSATFVSAEKRIRGLEAGADAYLTQPYEPEELLATCRALHRLQSAEEELRRRADRLVESDRRKDEFLAMLAHELRNPLAAIRTAIPLLEHGGARTPVEQRSMEILGRQSTHLARLVDDLLDVSRVTQGRILLAREPLDLLALLRGLVEGHAPQAAATDRRLELDLPSAPLHVDGDAGRLTQVFSNLIENALKYTNLGGTIRVSAHRAGSSVVVEITDDGIGIDPEVIPTIFALFSQARQSIDRSRGGLGIGLTLVRTLVELHGGEVSATSDGLGTGSCFRVQLPLSARGGAPEPEPASPAVEPTSGVRLLIVEDNEDARLALRDLCELWGHHVTVAADGLQGLAALESLRPDVALVDIGLPGIDGYEVARRARAALGGRPLRLIALTGYGAPEQVRRALDAGFDLHLIKPVDPARLERLLSA